MKIVYVGDNRNRGNFGCRATSTALSQLIEQENEIIGTVYGKYTNVDTGELFFYKFLPKMLYEQLGKISSWKHLKSGIYLFIRFLKKGKNYFFSNFDYLGYNMDESIENFIKCLPANPHLKEFDLRQYDFDALVVNGEGSFIFRNPPWRECLNELMLMHWAQKMGKKVYYMNGMLSDDPFTERNQKNIDVVRPVFEKCEAVCVRENYSYEYAKENFGNSNIYLYPDALFSWYDYINDEFEIPDGKYIMGMSGALNDSFKKFSFKEPYICISGSSAVGKATSDEEKIISTYVKLVNEVKKAFSHKIYLVEVCEGDHFLVEVGRRTNTGVITIDTPIISAGKILANADAYISGRYHPAILASLGGTPCIFMSSNSHKTKSLQELLEYDFIHEYYVLPSDIEIEKMIERTKFLLAQGQDLRIKIQKKCMELSNKSKEMVEVLRKSDR
ncbi:polysaccharide pyruvyl transferase family protein [Mediterraneibacter gnavus]|jgi:hypothetical protein|uniref:polysaccharide pyruvyl transferase family protein n=1 Tax=Mediterraneibacter gnavus TaxID=33038 RepID=UPI000C7BE0EA|nr:polysaccharide pyruvyl transferase family protein [Mediterraneibacter gnavus]PLT60047.1 hypothetical protein CCY17_14415 [Mediterraneibacter gnavus]